MKLKTIIKDVRELLAVVMIVGVIILAGLMIFIPILIGQAGFEIVYNQQIITMLITGIIGMTSAVIGYYFGKHTTNGTPTVQSTSIKDLLAIIIVIGFMVITSLLILVPICMGQNFEMVFNNPLIIGIITSLIATTSVILGYYFGKSMG